MIEFLSRMTALDVVFILLWLTAIGYGAISGIIRQVFFVGSITAGIAVASALSPLAGDWVGAVSGFGTVNAIPFTYSFLVVFIAILVFVTTERVYPATALEGLEIADRIVGGLLGFVAGLVTIAELTGILLIITEGRWAIFDGMRAYLRLELQATPFLPLIADTFGIVTSAIKSFLPLPIEEACEHCL
jgi:uncharacterized membrane protein required for colicin V production